jgi:hypothetical protein
VYTQVCLTSFLDLNPPNPLKKGAKIRILFPLFKGVWGIHTNSAFFLQRCVYTVAEGEGVGVWECSKPIHPSTHQTQLRVEIVGIFDCNTVSGKRSGTNGRVR